MGKLDEFIVGERSPEGLIAFFEQDDATGYLYLAEPDYKIRFDLHIYNRNGIINPTEEAVKVVWTVSGERCGVVIAGKLRGVLGINGDRYRPPMLSIESEGVRKPEWLSGFEAFCQRPTTDD